MLFCLAQTVIILSQRHSVLKLQRRRDGPWVLAVLKWIRFILTNLMMKLIRKPHLLHLQHTRKQGHLAQPEHTTQCASEWSVTEVELTNLTSIITMQRKNYPVQDTINMLKPSERVWCLQLSFLHAKLPSLRLRIDSARLTFLNSSHHQTLTLPRPTSWCTSNRIILRLPWLNSVWTNQTFSTIVGTRRLLKLLQVQAHMADGLTLPKMSNEMISILSLNTTI